MFRGPFPTCGFFFALTLPLVAQVNVLTYQYDTSRAGANLNEFLLTRASVNQNQFGKLFSFPVDGYIFGQPLYLAGVNIAGKGFHNVVYVATEHDSVYAFDADSNAGANTAPLWEVHFLGAGVSSVPGSDTNCSQITPEIGITSTPVIDPVSGTIYVVAMTKESGANVHRLHALDVSSGSERPGSPVVIQASYPGAGERGSTVVFAPKNYKQRPGLLLLGGVVYTAWSSHCDIGTYHGWLIGYDAQSLQQVSVYNNTANGNQGSFWTGGAAPAADADGNIYLVAGNGTFDVPAGGTDLGESFIKLSTSGRALSVKDYFAPFNFGDLNQRDLDIGSSGVALLPDEAGSASHPHLMAGSGKEGRVYVIDRDNLGQWQAGSDSQIPGSIASAVGGVFGNPAYFSKSVYFCGSGDSLKAFSVSNAILGRTPSSQTQARLGGCVPTVSANGAADGIVWALESAAVLHAFDSSNLASELYSSNQNRARDALGSYVKFSVPTVANGKVYAGTTTALVVYGLPGSLSVTNAASAQQNLIAPGSIISIYGTGLAETSQGATAFPLPATLAGATISINSVAVPMFFASSGQVNALVPFDTPLGAATVTVRSGGSSRGSASFVVQAAAPGLFLLDGSRAAALNQNGSVNGPGQGAGAGTVIAAYLTGMGAVDNPVAAGSAAPVSPLSRVKNVVTATLGGQPVSVLFAGLAPGFAGLYQVNVLVPQLSAGDYALQVGVAGVASNTGTISVR